jgi:hypothetical protein
MRDIPLEGHYFYTYVEVDFCVVVGLHRPHNLHLGLNGRKKQIGTILKI